MLPCTNKTVGSANVMPPDRYGTTTGRRRRCGWLDIPMLRYSHRLNGYDSINITKLDVLTGLKEIKIATHYKIKDRILPDGFMPASLEQYEEVEPVYLTLPGWSEDISECTSFDELPNNAKRWVCMCCSLRASICVLSAVRGGLPKELASLLDVTAWWDAYCAGHARYVLTIQTLMGVPVSWIGVGPDRKSMFLMPGMQKK